MVKYCVVWSQEWLAKDPRAVLSWRVLLYGNQTTNVVRNPRNLHKVPVWWQFQADVISKIHLKCRETLVTFALANTDSLVRICDVVKLVMTKLGFLDECHYLIVVITWQDMHARWTVDNDIFWRNFYCGILWLLIYSSKTHRPLFILVRAYPLNLISNIFWSHISYYCVI
jgi:hypothetical protein